MTTPEKIEDYLLITIEDSYKPKVQEYIDAVTTYIEHYTGRTFGADSGATERVFDGNGEDEIYIDDAVEITKVMIGDEEITEYYKYPSNRLPITRIILPYRIPSRPSKR
jgi:hypothetical protein